MYIQPEIIIGTGAIDSNGVVQPFGEVLGSTDVAVQVQDFTGELHITGHSRSVDWREPWQATVNNDPTYKWGLGSYGTMEPMSEYYFMLTQVLQHTDSNGKSA